ncbi:hypothetical protein DXV75_12115 [Alteromonas aestuariivivens]|uniref:Orphan protein n=2 Tax=Alteromonas aestuariivivens TaxID=1938339 RepID=A0A3D8M5F2_9ALTE|nr:hypothetical protein DXV75_12115 [Alteromonas aestuariivivens]
MALLLGFAGLASAHQIKAAITTVLFNPRTENIEVMHRFNLHDAEHAVKTLFEKSADILKDPKTQKDFAEYVTQSFALLDAEDQSLPLTLVGFETEGKFFWVYQETAQPPALDGLKIRHDALRELWPSQINTLNVEGNGPLKTLTFTDNVTLLEVEFDGQHH